LTSLDKHQAPDPSSFIADAEGKAYFRARMDARLLDASQVLYTVIYHSDGLTYYPFPNRGEYISTKEGDTCRSSFGVDAHRHLMIWQKR
jgi:hypothetical protein